MKSSVPAELVVGEIAWHNRDKNIAGIVPLAHRVNGEWRNAIPADYPPQGQLFWPKSGEREKGTLHVFRIRPTDSPGPEKDDLVVDSFELSYPVADFRGRTVADAVRALYAGPITVHGTGRHTDSVCLLCDDDLLVDPLPVNYAGPSNVTVDTGSKNLHRVPLHRDPAGIIGIDAERAVFIPATTPQGFIDCRSDKEIFKTALSDAAEFARELGEPVPQFAESKRFIAEITDAIAGSDANTGEIQRLERAARIADD